MPKILENPREKILNEACLLLEEGYSNFSMREIANRCEFALGTVYNYFKNKSDLIIEVFNIKWNETLEEAKNISNIDTDFENKIKLIYICLDKFLKYHKNIFFELSKEEMKLKEKREHSLNNYNVFDELYLLVDNIINLHKEKKEININIETRKLSSFFISNMLNLSMKKLDFSIDDLLYIALNKK